MSLDRFSSRLAMMAAMTLVPVLYAHAQPTIVQPGAPGQPSRQITAQEAANLIGLRYTEADVRFMQHMISHHHQAVEMTDLVEGRSLREEVQRLAQRISLSQEDEIAMMQEWLRERDLEVPDATAHHGHHHMMAGMISDEEMQRLADSTGGAFDNLFLEFMIKHHEGAVTMVEELLTQPGSAQDAVMFEFANEVSTEQRAEIERMTAMLAGFSPDPRVGLSAGFYDAGEASLNMDLLLSLPKPDGFFDPENPAGLPMSRIRQLAAGQDPSLAPEAPEDDEQAEPRPSLLNFANTDLAFAGDKLIVGNYHGFNIYNLGETGLPELASSVVCPGGQGDVSVVGNLVLYSAQQTNGRLDCGLQGVAETVSEERFRGLRIFDISDVTAPVQVGAVQTCRGSHTHTVVSGPDEEGNIIVYNSGTSIVRSDEELEGCSNESPYRDPDTSRFRIDIIKIPMHSPQDAHIVDSPFVFADPDSGVLAALWEGGDHGPGTQRSAETNHCHDITAYPELGLAAGACSGNGILFDISDPLRPTRLHEVVDTGFAYWHSATFNNDGTKVVFTDEWGGGSRPRCRASDPLHWGANAIYDIVDNQLEFRSYYKMPAPQTEQENCVAHNGSLVPVPGRDILVQSWYQGGISVKDFTDSANPVEIAFFDRGPIDEEHLVMGGYWSAYWYRGLIYGTEIARGLDILALTPSDYLSANELAAAALWVPEDDFNPQLQTRHVWPAEPVVARAYLDQLRRSNTIAASQAQVLDSLLDRSETLLTDGGDGQIATVAQLDRFAAQLSADSAQLDGITARRHASLAETLNGIADRLR